MKFYSLETISDLMNCEFAYCMMADFIDAHKPNTLTWWKWGMVCPKCGISSEERIVPWKMQWCSGNAPVGDFAGSNICQQRVINFFRNNNFHIKRVDVEFVNFESHPSKSGIGSMFSTTLYEGPKMYGIDPLYGVHLNDIKSNITRISNCSVCGNVKYDMFQKGYPSDFWKGLVIDEEEWNGLKLFGLFEFGSLLDAGSGLFVSEEGRDLLVKQGFSNMRFLEVGRIEKAGSGKMKPYRDKAEYDFWQPGEYAE